MQDKVVDTPRISELLTGSRKPPEILVLNCSSDEHEEMAENKKM